MESVSSWFRSQYTDHKVRFFVVIFCIVAVAITLSVGFGVNWGKKPTAPNVTPTPGGNTTTTAPPTITVTPDGTVVDGSGNAVDAPVGEDTSVVATTIPTTHTVTITDCGYGNKPRGWYDVLNRGYYQDYCRFIGDGDWWACAVNGATWQYSPRGMYSYDPTRSFQTRPDVLTGMACSA